MVKIEFSKKENKKDNGIYVMGNRNHKSKIIIYKNSDDKLRTLIHELIHNFLHEKSLAGYKSRIMNQINDDEKFVEGLSLKIKNGIDEYVKQK